MSFSQIRNVHSFDYDWYNVSDQADLKSQLGDAGYIVFGVVLFVWELLTTPEDTTVMTILPGTLPLRDFREGLLRAYPERARAFAAPVTQWNVTWDIRADISDPLLKPENT